MLVDDVQAVIIFYQPVGFKYLTNDFIFLHGLSCKQMIFKSSICFGVSVRDGSGLVVSSVFVDIVIFDLLDAFCM